MFFFEDEFNKFFKIVTENEFISNIFREFINNCYETILYKLNKENEIEMNDFEEKDNTQIMNQLLVRNYLINNYLNKVEKSNII